MRNGFFFLLLGASMLSCGGRPEAWNEEFVAGDVVGLQTAVAVMDPSVDRVIMLESPSHLGLEATYLPVGMDVVKTMPTPKRDRLLVLSQGVQPRKRASDQLPRLTVVDTMPSPRVSRTYELSAPFSGLNLDPEGQWALVHAGEGLLENPNELILVNLESPDDEPFIKSIRSFGGRPSRFTFTTPLTIAGQEPRRLLVVQTEQDLALIDLARLEAPEITVISPDSESGRFSQPALVAFHDVTEDSDPVLAISFENSSGVLLIGLVAGDDDQAFSPQINSIVDVGGKPSAIDFVMTNDGLRLAALVPTSRHAALVDPTTTAVDLVPMPAAFTGLARITDSISEESETDFALLWAEQQAVLGIWSLDAAVSTPYNSVTTFDIAVGVGQVLDVPGPEQGACRSSSACFAQYKIIETYAAQEFYLLDLQNRRVSLMVPNENSALSLSLSPDGERLWAFSPEGLKLSQVGFSNLHPVPLDAEVAIQGVYNVGRRGMATEGGDASRSAVVLHTGEGLAATVYDGLSPDGAVTRFYSGLAYGGLSR